MYINICLTSYQDVINVLTDSDVCHYLARGNLDVYVIKLAHDLCHLVHRLWRQQLATFAS